MGRDDTQFVFVYGTLRRGSGHALARVLAEQARYLGTARSPGRLYDLGPYPGMTAAAVAEQVQGDLYELADAEVLLATLDGYEGCGPGQERPWLFERCLREAILEMGERFTAWVYLYCGPVHEDQRLASGEYRVSS